MSDAHTFNTSRNTANQLFRYALVGIISNASGYLIYLLATYAGATPKLTMSLLYGAGAAMGFFGNRSISFSYKGSLLGSGIRYLMAHIVGYLINLTILIIFVDRLGYPHQLVQGAAILAVAAFLFTAFKFFVFKAINTESAQENL